MKKIIHELFELQELQFKSKITSEQAAQVEILRKKIPAQILVNFDRSHIRGKRSVSIVRNGVCSECHLRIPLGVVTSLASREEMQRCGNCGRYLYLPEKEPVSAPVPAKTPKSAKKKELAHAV